MTAVGRTSAHIWGCTMCQECETWKERYHWGFKERNSDG